MRSGTLACTLVWGAVAALIYPVEVVLGVAPYLLLVGLFWISALFALGQSQVEDLVIGLVLAILATFFWKGLSEPPRYLVIGASWVYFLGLPWFHRKP